MPFGVINGQLISDELNTEQKAALVAYLDLFGKKHVIVSKTELSTDRFELYFLMPEGGALDHEARVKEKRLRAALQKVLGGISVIAHHVPMDKWFVGNINYAQYLAHKAEVASIKELVAAGDTLPPSLLATQALVKSVTSQPNQPTLYIKGVQAGDMQRYKNLIQDCAHTSGFGRDCSTAIRVAFPDLGHVYADSADAISGHLPDMDKHVVVTVDYNQSTPGVENLPAFTKALEAGLSKLTLAIPKAHQITALETTRMKVEAEQPAAQQRTVPTSPRLSQTSSVFAQPASGGTATGEEGAELVVANTTAPAMGASSTD